MLRALVRCVWLCTLAHISAGSDMASAIVPEHQASSGPSVKMIRARGHQIFSQERLTEGPHVDDPASFDSLEAYFDVPIPETHRWVVGWQPRVKQQQVPSCDSPVELPHHMNILVGQGQETRFLATYDRGAQGFHFGTDQQGTPLYGIPVGSKPARLEYHLLVPKCWDFGQTPSVLESSGIDLFVSSVAPKAGAAILGAMDQQMAIKPGTGRVDHITHISAHKLEEALDGAHSVELLAVHLHTHYLFNQKFLEIKSSDGSIKFRSNPEPTGYGASEQSMLTLAQKGWPRLQLEQGDVVDQHCLVDTAQLEQTLVDGTSWGNEMCGPLFIVGGEGIGAIPTQLTLNGHY